MDTRLPDSITVDILKSWRDDGTDHLLLDVREAPEWAVCRIDGAMHLPMQEIPARLDELPRDRRLVVMCHHGMRSRMVAQYLRQQGLAQVLNLDGGIDAWAALIEPGMARY